MCHEARFPRKRCGKCGSVITSAGITFAGASYHAACFLCTYTRTNEGRRGGGKVHCYARLVLFPGITCKQPISAQSKISMVDGQPCCVNCYEDQHAKRCSRCQKAIVADVEYLEFEDKYWHKECFICSKCQVNRPDSLVSSRSCSFRCLFVEMHRRGELLSRWKLNSLQGLHLTSRSNGRRLVCLCAFALITLYCFWPLSLTRVRSRLYFIFADLLMLYSSICYFSFFFVIVMEEKTHTTNVDMPMNMAVDPHHSDRSSFGCQSCSRKTCSSQDTFITRWFSRT